MWVFDTWETIDYSKDTNHLFFNLLFPYTEDDPSARNYQRLILQTSWNGHNTNLIIKKLPTAASPTNYTEIQVEKHSEFLSFSLPMSSELEKPHSWSMLRHTAQLGQEDEPETYANDPILNPETWAPDRPYSPRDSCTQRLAKAIYTLNLPTRVRDAHEENEPDSLQRLLDLAAFCIYHFQCPVALDVSVEDFKFDEVEIAVMRAHTRRNGLDFEYRRLSDTPQA